MTCVRLNFLIQDIKAWGLRLSVAKTFLLNTSVDVHKIERFSGNFTQFGGRDRTIERSIMKWIDGTLGYIFIEALYANGIRLVFEIAPNTQQPANLWVKWFWMKNAHNCLILFPLKRSLSGEYEQSLWVSHFW